jgi:uncharacterized cupin superfamily protein
VTDVDDVRGVGVAVDLGGSGEGPVWGMASDDLNATLLVWPAGHEVAAHVNAELDVLIAVLEGEASVAIDDAVHVVRAPGAILVPRGARRSVRAGASGVRYLSVHRRRGPLQISGLGSS